MTSPARSDLLGMAGTVISALRACGLRGDGDGVHEAIEVAKQGMTDAQILKAGRLAGQETGARSLIDVVPARQRRGRHWRPWR